MVERFGLWPGVVAIVGDADLHCVPCAKRQYGAAAVEAVIEGLPGYEDLTDQEGNPFSVVLSGSEDLREMCCGDCFTQLDKEDGEQWQAIYNNVPITTSSSTRNERKTASHSPTQLDNIRQYQHAKPRDRPREREMQQASSFYLLANQPALGRIAIGMFNMTAKLVLRRVS